MSSPGRVFISGQKRGVFGVIKRELRRRSAIEPVIGHMKTDGHLGRYLKGRDGDAANAILSAIGHNLRLVLAWLRMILRFFFVTLFWSFTMPGGLKYVRRYERDKGGGTNEACAIVAMEPSG